MSESGMHHETTPDYGATLVIPSSLQRNVMEQRISTYRAHENKILCPLVTNNVNNLQLSPSYIHRGFHQFALQPCSLDTPIVTGWEMYLTITLHIYQQREQVNSRNGM